MPDPSFLRAIAHLATAALLTLAHGAAAAWGSLLLIDGVPEAAATRAAGASVWRLPRAPGARAADSVPIPAIDLYGMQGWFLSTDNGIGWNFSRRSDLQAGLRLWPHAGRSAAQSPAGVSAIGWRLQSEAFLNWQALPELLLQSGLLHGAGRHHDGTQLEVGATSGLPLAVGLLGLGVSATWADAAFRRSYFGVSAGEALASGLRSSAPAAGWQDAGLTLSGEHRFDAQWSASGQFIRARLLGAAAASPLTSSRWQTAAAVSVWRSF